MFIPIALMLVAAGCGGDAPPAVADASDDLAADMLAPLDAPGPDGQPPDGPVAFDAAPADDQPGADDVAAEPPAPDVATMPDAAFRCTGDAQCAGHPDGSVCDATSGRCVLCTTVTDRCPAGQYCLAGMNLCVPGCRDDAACAAAGGDTRYCDPVRHTCVVCVRDEQCSLGALCAGGLCVAGCSASRPCPGGQGCCVGACVDTEMNIANCGVCGRACTPPNATPICRRGACAVGSCTAPFGNCDGDDANGCETDLSATASACGACGTSCASRPNSTPRCEMGACRYTCTSGFGDCDGNVANGCESNLSTTPAHCGMCGRACSLRNATAGCSLGACVVAACDVGFGDCNGNPADGCETDLRTSLSHCGGCGRGCSPPNSIPVCSAGMCRVVGCDRGYGECDRDPTNGCEVRLVTPTNCGSCGGTCPAPTGPHTVSRCVPQGDTVGCDLACESGYVDCDRNLMNGCETTGACTVERELFYDGFESGGGRWSVDSVWRVFNAGFYSPCAGTLEMFGERRPGDPCGISGDATLISPIDISRATTLTLTHQSRAYVEGLGQLNVSVSTDGGRVWSVVASQPVATCGLRAVDLGAYVGQSTLLLRFSYQGSSRCETTFWRLDEVRVRALVRNY